MVHSLFSDPGLQAEIEKNTRRKIVARDNVLMSPGDDIVFVPIVLSGSLRIVRQNDEGREVFLYHLYPGQTCALAINCCQSNKKSMVKAVAEDDTEVLLVPVNLVEEWFRYPEWRSYVNSTYSHRFAELINVIDMISFSNMDAQLLRYLRERSRALNTKILQVTHQQIADELHTHREVISRLLRTMEEKSIVKLGRNIIELLDSSAI